MPETETSSPTEVLGLERDPYERLESDEREYLYAETGELAKYWEGAYSDALEKTSTWDEFRQEIYDNHQAQQALRGNYEDNPAVLRAFDKVNYIFGSMPSALVDPQANLLLASYRNERGNVAKLYSEEDMQAIKAGNHELNTHQSAMREAEWINETIWSLLRFRANELTEPKSFTNGKGRKEVIEAGQTLPEMLIPLMAKTFEKGMPARMARQEFSWMLSGVYGPVKLARAARAAGFRAILPNPYWDVVGKVDLNLATEDRRTLYPVQIKSTRQSAEFARYFSDAPSMDFGGREVAPRDEWTALDNFCAKVQQTSNWRSSGIDIIPKWARMYDAQADIAGFKAVLADKPDPKEVELLAALKGNRP
ncbi:MAG: hypothetical protein HZB70_01125 [Candidatus Berkelbacteria bacterium]|nr:MAG: hypothetical protein HZB70_01125 [Candidatus Berkelbacteria bacterium]QQG52059.1 MAG: hypothetical protein HY845_01870 [Candidatus Berkelbacteria bacterium]